MNLIELVLVNFRRYEKARFKFHSQFTVLIGENGKGKTAILDALAIMLGTYFQGSGIKTGAPNITQDDARLMVKEKGDQLFYESEKDVSLNVVLEYRYMYYNFYRLKGDRGRLARNFIQIGDIDRVEAIKKDDYFLPLLLYYGSGRLWDKHRNVETEKPGSQMDAYRFCLDPKSDQAAFEKWFKKLSFSELQKSKKIAALDAVRNAVLQCIPDAIAFYHDTDEDRIVIKLENEGIIPFNNLSDGYRNVIAMVADIAHRAAKLNPGLMDRAALETEGVVLVDEIDLHLHPKWQRRVARDLQAAFPKMQFIATTHSPFIIQSLDPGEVIDLNQSPIESEIFTGEEQLAVPGPQHPFSNRSIEDITEEIMGVEVPQRSYRYKQMYDTAKEYYKLLEEAKHADNKVELETVKNKLDALSAPFSENVAYHAFLEMERIAAGFGSFSKKGDNEKCDR